MKSTLLTALAFLGIAASAAAQTEIIAPNATWDYLHPLDGIDPAFTDPDFETTWQGYTGYDGPAFFTDVAGPFSYGGITYFTAANGGPGSLIGVGGTATAPDVGLRFSAYFKKQFTAVEDYADATVRMLADDGAIIYLDGVEVKRVNMLNTAGGYYGLLADNVTNTESQLVADFSIGAISAGPHVIAVSLHNAAIDSSDLGLLFQLFGSAPPPVPPPVILRTDFGGVFTDVRADAPFGAAGWNADSPPLSFAHVSGGASTLNSAPVDLTAVGEVYFTAQIYIYETSTTSNFEDDDSFNARLEVTRDDDSITEIPLVPAELDVNSDLTLTGEEFNPGGLAVDEAVFIGRQLSAAIPAEAKSVRVLISSDCDSTSEEFDLGGMLISDVAPGSDADGDGVAREAELFAQTDPNDSASCLRIKEITRTFDEGTLETTYDLTYPGVINLWYVIEFTTDNQNWRLFGFSRPAATDPNRPLSLVFDNTEDDGQGFLLRLRAVP